MARHRAPGPALAALALLALAGCGGPAPAPPRTSAPATPRTSAPATPPPPATADARGLRACADADCEVTVAAPVDIAFAGPEGRAGLTVTEAGRAAVGYRLVSGEGHTRGSATGPGSACWAVLSAGGSSGGCGPGAPAPTAAPGTVALHLAATGDGTAVVRISRG